MAWLWVANRVLSRCSNTRWETWIRLWVWLDTITYMSSRAKGTRLSQSWISTCSGQRIELGSRLPIRLCSSLIVKALPHRSASSLWGFGDDTVKIRRECLAVQHEGIPVERSSLNRQGSKLLLGNWPRERLWRHTSKKVMTPLREHREEKADELSQISSLLFPSRRCAQHSALLVIQASRRSSGCKDLSVKQNLKSSSFWAHSGRSPYLYME